MGSEFLFSANFLPDVAFHHIYPITSPVSTRVDKKPGMGLHESVFIAAPGVTRLDDWTKLLRQRRQPKRFVSLMIVRDKPKARPMFGQEGL
jgi:hypothetical protein